MNTSLILIFQVIINGLIKGLIYALTAAGFSLIYGQAKVLFFALGEIYMLGAILSFLFIVVLGFPYPLAIALSLFGLGLFGVILERQLFRPLEARSPLISGFASLLLGMLIVGISMFTFGERARGIPNPFPGKLNLLSVIVTIDKLVVVLVSIAFILGLHLFFNHARAGRTIRAVAQNRDAAELVGISLNRTKALTFFLALAVTGAAGGIVSPLSFVDVFMGGPMLMTTLIVVVLGGLGSFPGAIVGGLVIGMVESFGVTFVGGGSTIITFVVAIIVLIFRPQGLLGRV